MGQHETHRMQETSLRAWDEFQGKIGKRQDVVFRAFAELCEVQGDATDREAMSHLMQQERNYVSPRRFELANELKLIGYSDTRRCKVNNSTCRSWKLTKRGLHYWNNLKKNGESKQATQEIKETNQEVPKVPEVSLPDCSLINRISSPTI